MPRTSSAKARQGVTPTKSGEKRYKPDTVRLAFRKYFVGEESDEGEQRAFCPICENPNNSKTPSAMFNAEDGVWNCLKGNHGGSIRALAADLKRERGWDIRSEAMKARHEDPEFSEKRARALNAAKKSTSLPTAEQIAVWHRRLLASERPLGNLMNERGFSRETIVEYDIGWDGSRYQIPVYDEDGELVNVRRYQMHASDAKYKMLNFAGHGEARIYGLQVLADNDRIVLSEGEPDMILNNQYGIPTVTHTAGAKTFRAQWGPLFQGKVVFICYDNDETGKLGAAKAKAIIKPYAEAVYTIFVPIDARGADITDFYIAEGHSAEDFLKLMKDAEESADADSVQVARPVPDSGRGLSLMESMAQENQNETIELVVSVAGKQAEPFTAPRMIRANCDMSKGAACESCPVAGMNGEMEVELRPDDTDLFRFIDSTEQRRRLLLREVVGARCTDRVEYEVPEDYHIEELLVQASVDDRKDSETQQPVRRTVFSISTHRSGVNEKLRLVGRNVPDTKTGRLRFMAWHNEGVELDIDKFELTSEIRDRLFVFQPDESQSPLDKCLEIAGDLSENVTHIYGRDILHVAFDMIWHSVGSFKIGDRVERKGWLEALIVGDTRTGKSEVASRLMRHYRSGQMLSCEGMSFAGIVGGVQQIDGRWHLTWGAVPMNDRRMVVLDEVSGLKDKDVIEQMSSIRSSGVAQITKISSEATSARTRLAWIGNPADGSMLADFPGMGMDALRTLVPANEDIARFDFVIAAAKGEVPDEIINAGFSELHDPVYKSEDCEALIKWTWSLTRNDVVFSEAAAKASVKAALDLGRRYVTDPPLIQSENVRFKLLRIAAAIAARTFSVNRAGKLIVNKEHIVDAVRFLDEIYGRESMGYARRSRRALAAAARAKDRREACIAYLKSNEDTVLLTLQMVGGKTFRTRDFTDFAAMNSDEAQAAVKRLMSWKMAHMKSRGDIGMDPELIRILRQIEDEDYEA